MAAKAKKVDWVLVEVEYRAGILTDRAIGKNHGISHAMVQKQAKAQGWTKDLSKRIEKRRDDKVARAALAKKGSQATPATEKQVVEANADLQTNILLSHRQDVGVLKKTIVGMAKELDALTGTELQEALHDLMEADCKETDSEARKTALRKAYHAAMALGGRAGAGQKLAAALATLIDKERQAFGIDKAGNDNDLAGFLKGLDTPRAAG